MTGTTSRPAYDLEQLRDNASERLTGYTITITKSNTDVPCVLTAEDAKKLTDEFVYNVVDGYQRVREIAAIAAGFSTARRAGNLGNDPNTPEALRELFADLSALSVTEFRTTAES